MSEKRKVVCFGPGPRFKGGIQNYNTSLALALDKHENTEVHIVSWTQQYPAIIPREFVDKKSKNDLLEGSNVQVTYLTNYNKPSTWRKTISFIQELNPEIVIFQWSIAVQGLPIGYMVNRLRKLGIEVILDLHFVIQKENSKLDKWFTKRGISNANTYIVHALKTHKELEVLYPKKAFPLSYDGLRVKNAQTVIKLFHPIYDLFKPDPKFDIQAFKEAHKLEKFVFLYFGFIRKYKGLHNAIEAFSKVAAERKDVSFLICGESFWNTLDNKKWSTKFKQLTFGLVKKLLVKKSDDEKKYNPLAKIKELNLENRCVVYNEFVPNEDVHRYFQVADVAVLYYLYATPSGIESLSYNFSLPLLATNVGHFPETIQHGFNGYLAESENIEDMAKQMIQSIDKPINPENVRKSTENMSWDNYAKAILNRVPHILIISFFALFSCKNKETKDKINNVEISKVDSIIEIDYCSKIKNEVKLSQLIDSLKILHGVGKYSYRCTGLEALSDRNKIHIQVLKVTEIRDIGIAFFSYDTVTHKFGHLSN